MHLQFEATPIEQLTHVRDLMDTDRAEADRRLKLITKLLGNTALESIDLGHGLDTHDLTT